MIFTVFILLVATSLFDTVDAKKKRFRKRKGKQSTTSLETKALKPDLQTNLPATKLPDSPTAAAATDAPSKGPSPAPIGETIGIMEKACIIKTNRVCKNFCLAGNCRTLCYDTHERVCPLIAG